MADINFHQIAARLGSQSNAFEELCCQLARQVSVDAVSFERFRGAGGDGGVECIARAPDGSLRGWQAKFVFDVDNFIAQADDSLSTALALHADLTHYVLCFPFNPTGKTGRKSKSGRTAKSATDKLGAWTSSRIATAKKSGRNLTIDLWPSSNIQALLLQHDASGGIRHYFFDETVLSTEWFKNQLTVAAKAAGPRYTPALNVETDLWKWFLAFAGDSRWLEEYRSLLNQCEEVTKRLRACINEKSDDALSPRWPAAELQAGIDAIKTADETFHLGRQLEARPTESGLTQFLQTITRIKSLFEALETALVRELEAQHGQGKADSRQFRTFMAEYMVSFPAANLDALRDTAASFETLEAWLASPRGYLAFKKVFVLSGAGGSGKTHGICDAALKRTEEGGLCCVLFGHQFSGSPAEWTRLVESLGLGAGISKDRILDALNTAGEASGTPLIFCIDALNETRPRDYWLNRLLPLAHEFEQRPMLKLAVSCRTSFQGACLPQSHPFPVVEHRGFAGIEREACRSFFEYYDLEPPIVPVLQSELTNPLYLRLVCETLKLRGLRRLPAGWVGLTPVISAFLSEKEKQFGSENGVSVGAGIVSGSLLAIASAIADTGNTALPWSEAQRVVNDKRPQAANLPVIEWLVKAELLIEDGPSDGGGVGEGESVLRPAFERFGDFLVATELLPKTTPKRFASAFRASASVRQIIATPASVRANAGVIQALSVLVPETAGLELPNLIDDPPTRSAVIVLAVRALPWRTPDSFSQATRVMVRESLNSDLAETMDSLLAVATHSSAIDARWLNGRLSAIPLGQREGFWSGYLHLSYKEGGIVKRLIDASGDVDLRKVERDTASHWALILLWFTAAADRRVKDEATRAAAAIFRAQPSVISELIEMLLEGDDDEIRERVLLSAYGALVVSRDKEILKALATMLLTAYASAPNCFQNALIRDHIRCIGELARHLSCLGPQLDPLLPLKRQQSSEWPLSGPTKEELAEWAKLDGALGRVQRSSLNDDFNHYSIGCLGPWMHHMSKPAIGAWILKHVIEQLGLPEQRIDNYDNFMVSFGGGGRSKPVWAERIGKKHQWIALFRLASRLHDHVDRKEDDWEPAPVREPLILMDERKLDPTLSLTAVPSRKSFESWWVRAHVDLGREEKLDDASWVAKKDDLPDLAALLEPTSRGDQRWLILTSYPGWNEYRPNMDYGTPYRDAWLHLRGYLVPEAHFRRSINALQGRNYFGMWMPNAAKWLHAFAGEYPWGTSFNTEPDWYLDGAEKVRGTSFEFIHASNEICIEWEYDATLPSSIYLEVPTKKFFSQDDLWWNGKDGFAAQNDRTVFYDPRFADGGPPTLLADVDDLRQRLDHLGYRLLWTMLGEKRVLGEKTRDLPGLCYSQLAWLETDGSVATGDRRFFADYNEDQGLAVGA